MDISRIAMSVLVGVAVASSFIALTNQKPSVPEHMKQIDRPASTEITGQNIPDVVGYVNDEAKILNEIDEVQIKQKLQVFSESDKGEMAVVTVNSLNGLSVEEFAIRLAEKWQVGKEGKDDGIIIIIAKQERKVRIEVGRGTNITDSQAKQVLDDVMIPKLKEGDWAGAIDSGVESLINLANR